LLVFLTRNWTFTMKAAQWVEKTGAELENSGVYFGHGTDNAHDEAAWLVLHVIGAALDGSFTDWGRELDDCEVEQLKRLLQERIATRAPLAYLTGIARFAGLDFETSRVALVPRSPLGELIQEHFHPWVKAHKAQRILDLCTGSACIAIAMAHHMPWVQVDATDISRPALELAARNRARHAMEQRVTLIESDLFHSLPACRYDLIVTNPPYVPDDAISALPVEYQVEPVLGLASGEDGLDATLSILATAPDYMADDGVLVCEVGESEQRLQALLPRLPFVWLEFAQGGSGVFVLGKDDLKSGSADVLALLEERKNVA
jgi:ribosomal protein L3 glutamine methyltransferase